MLRWTWVGAAFLIMNLALGTAPAQEAKPGQVGGTLFQPNGREAPHTLLLIRNTVTRISLQDRTDKHGRFRIKKVPPGEYQVESLFNGITYRYTATVKVRPGELTLLCLQMRNKDQVLFQREGRCEPEPAFLIWPWVVGGGVIGGGVVVYLATKEEASPTRP